MRARQWRRIMALRPLTKWRRIARAPRDGTRFVAADGHGYPYISWWTGTSWHGGRPRFWVDENMPFKDDGGNAT